MTESCCHHQQSLTRGKHHPEVAKRDACVEYDPRLGIHYLADNKGEFVWPIYFCPWCATPLPPRPELQAIIDELDASGFVGVIKIEALPEA